MGRFNFPEAHKACDVFLYFNEIASYLWVEDSKSQRNNEKAVGGHSDRADLGLLLCLCALSVLILCFGSTQIVLAENGMEWIWEFFGRRWRITCFFGLLNYLRTSDEILHY